MALTEAKRAAAGSPAPGRTTVLPYFPALDGLRALAVVAVLLFHGGFDWAQGGYLGVSTFFTLSGFLITSLLLNEHRTTGTIARRRFWTRRLRRLMPTALVGLTITTLYGATVADATQRANLAGDTIAALTYTTNWRFILNGQTYAQLFAAPSPLQHYWSLAIEEQFYLLFPLIMLAGFGTLRTRNRAPRPHSRRNLTITLTTLLAATWALPLIFNWTNDRIYYGTATRAPELLTGALLAITLNHRRVTSRIATDRSINVALNATGIAAVVAMVVVWAAVPESTGWLYKGGFGAYSLLSVALITAALLPTGPIRNLLARTAPVTIGKLSYSIYVVHWPIFLFTDALLPATSPAAQPWPSFAIKIAATAATATACYHYIENPIRRGQPLFGPKHPTITPARLAPIPIAAIALTTIAITTLSPPPPIDFDQARQDLAAATEQAHSTSQPAGDPEQADIPTPRIAAFGDSTAMLLAWGINSSLRDSGDGIFAGGWTQLGCGLSRYGQRRNNLGEGPISEECNNWDEYWATELEEGDPNVAVVLVGPWEVMDRKLPDDTVWRAIGDPVYDDYLLSEMLEAVDLVAEHDAVVVWLTTPTLRATDGADAAVTTGPASDPRRRDRFNELIREVAELRPDSVRVVELGAWLDDLGEQEDLRLRPDGVHFGALEAREVMDRWLSEQIIEAYEDVWPANADS